jgi:type IV secretory pathway TrbD component
MLRISAFSATIAFETEIAGGEATVDLATGRDIALVILIIEAFVLALVPLAAFYFGIRGMRALRLKIDPQFPMVQGRLRRMAQTTRTASERIVRPFIALGVLRAQAKGTTQALIRTAASARPHRNPGRYSARTTERDAT